MTNEPHNAQARLVSLGRLDSTASCRTRVLSRTEELSGIRAQWNDLQAAMGDSNPFTQWEWVWHWWHLFGKSTLSIHHKLHIVVVEDGSTVRAIFPLIMSTIGRGPVKITKLHMYGFTGSFTEIRAPLVWPGWEERAAAALLKILYKQRSLYHWCVLEGLPANSALGKWFSTKAPLNGWMEHHPITDYVITLPTSWQELRRGMKRNLKESLRHCYNSLARAGHEWQFETVTEASEIATALEEFFNLHRLRAGMPSSVSHPDYFASTTRRAFLRLLARDLAPKKRFMVCRLRVDGEVVASRPVLITESSMYLYYSGFDPAWRQYSVMTTLTAECIKEAMNKGLSTVNLSPGTDVSKTRWGPAAQVYASVRIPSPTPAGRSLFFLRKRISEERLPTPGV